MTERRRRGLRAIGAILPAATEDVRRKHGHLPAALFSGWEAIAGPSLAARCRPTRLAHGRDGGVLHLAVDGPIALELQHLAPLLISRINASLGAGAVTRLALRPTAGPPRALAPPPPIAAPPPTVREPLAAPADALAATLEGLRHALAARRG